MPRELEELLGPSEHRPALGTADDVHTVTAAELEQPLVAQLAKRPQHRVRVDAEYRRHIARRR